MELKKNGTEELDNRNYFEFIYNRNDLHVLYVEFCKIVMCDKNNKKKSTTI